MGMLVRLQVNRNVKLSNISIFDQLLSKKCYFLLTFVPIYWYKNEKSDFLFVFTRHQKKCLNESNSCKSCFYQSDPAQ